MLQKSVPAQKIHIVGEKTLFEEGLTSMLVLDANMEVSGSKYTDDGTLLADILHNQPDVILLNSSVQFNTAHVLETIISNPILQTSHVIVFSLDSSMVDVYEMPRRLQITRREELVAVVQGRLNAI